MTNPAAKEIVTAMRDFERAVAQQPGPVFAPAWAQTKPPCNVSILFDPQLSPTLHAKAKRTLHTLKMLGRQARLLLHYPFLREAGSKPDELTTSTADGDALAVFVHDVRDNEAQAYVLTDRPREHTECTVQTDWPRDVWLNGDGRPVIRLTDHFAHSFVWGEGGRSTYVTSANELDPFMSPAQQFIHRLRFGTLTGDACDARVSARCGGRTLMLVQNCGMTNLCWEFCEHCYDAAIDTAKANYQEQVADAWRNPPIPKWGVRGA
ncbi:hypothetical protein [Mycolicibacterium holsaticum]|uniref:hypothetical protein n=1 Tax=Mycolicibacterium holsaticum TaxID=152142 RepID=UPI001C7D1692|nr:hypothetical protein [Mycolicibacterium holsaticum]MDA4105702.1 hypothetical protein [Mycolicibacterium holsaticum DSM 44478 = JCM 12374]QZA13927.1 hypothetical protein K3U96_07320 [Mycolicibacterium holsaticum DSM 44478 = JCM 12374]UNC08613.1 hypothetical protein H5U41_19510 [Mycolicibacterium holsaticum DSM 44478 = JCM 12374]